MGYRFFAFQEITREKLAIALVNIPLVALHEFGFLSAIDAVQSVP